MRLLPIFEQHFIEDTYNCRKGNGTDYGINRVLNFTKNHQNGWILKYDISCFFMSINKTLLNSMLKTFICDNYSRDDKDEILSLVEMIVMHRPELLCIRKGDLSLWNQLQKGKSLFRSDGNHGLAIGNLTSQIFANFYMSQIDKWLASIDGVEYGRYVDDAILVSDDKNLLLSILPKLRERLSVELDLELHKKKIYIQPVRHGVSFLGSVIKNGRLYAGNHTVTNAFNITKEFACRLDKESCVEKFAQRYNSYMGYLIHRKTYAIRWNLWNNVDEETKKFVYLTKRMGLMRVRDVYKEKTKLKSQYKHDKRNISNKRLGGVVKGF
jgi:hypothetical protein